LGFVEEPRAHGISGKAGGLDIHIVLRVRDSLNSGIDGHGLISDPHPGVISGIPGLKRRADTFLALIGFLILRGPDTGITT
jgi:hypothetical protein